jgi:hypothetical protein
VIAALEPVTSYTGLPQTLFTITALRQAARLRFGSAMPCE